MTTKKPISLALNKAYQDSISTMWNIAINQFRDVEGFRIDDSVLVALNAWNDNGPRWPDFANRYSETPEGLISYKGYPLHMKMSVYGHGQYCTLRMPACSTWSYGEDTSYYYNENTLDPDLVIHYDRDLKEEEKTGKQLTKTQVLGLFGKRKEKRHNNAVSWYAATDGLDWVVAKLDNCIELITKSKKSLDFSKQEDKLYNKYLKNRWPKVESYLKTVPKK